MVSSVFRYWQDLLLNSKIAHFPRCSAATDAVISRWIGQNETRARQRLTKLHKLYYRFGS